MGDNAVLHSVSGTSIAEVYALGQTLPPPLRSSLFMVVLCKIMTSGIDALRRVSVGPMNLNNGKAIPSPSVPSTVPSTLDHAWQQRTTQ